MAIWIMLKKTINWLFVLLWMVVIFYFSSLPDLKSELPTLWDTIFRKIAHISEFFVLSYFIFRALKEYRLKFINLIIITAIFSLLYAFLDEFHQTFTQGRDGNVIDVGIDSIGIATFIILLYIHKKNILYEDIRYK